MRSPAILLTALANMAVRAGMSWTIGGRAAGTRVALVYLAIAACGLAAVAPRLT